VKKALVGMGWNLVWYVPLGAGLLGLTWINARDGYHNSLVLLHQHWKALALPLSPSACVWLIVNFVSISAPVRMAALIPGLLDGCDDRRRHGGRLAAWLGGFLVLMSLLQVLDWGSFPLVRLGDGSLYMRMIPFL
jgi:hypothetical protein